MVLPVGIAGTLAAFEVAGRATRDGYYLSQLPASSLPFAVAASAVLALVATLAMSAWLRRSAPQRVAPLALVAAGAGFAALGGLATVAPRPAAAALYLHMTGLVPVAVAAFWAMVNEHYDPYTAKSVVTRMLAVAALGGVVGGVAAERATVLLGMPVVLFVLAGLCLACGWSTWRMALGEDVSSRPQSEGEAVSGVRALFRRPLLRQMALLMLTVAVVETLVDYALKVEAAASFASQEALVRFFAAFYVGCGVLSFLIQLVLRDRMLRGLGLASAVAMLPASVALFGAMAAFSSRLWVFVLTRGAETVASLAFFRSGFQLLYTPISSADRRPAKPWVDVAAGSAGELIGAALVFLLLLLIPWLPGRSLLGLASAGSLAALWIVLRIHRSYVAQLGQSLQTGQLTLHNEDALDATTAMALAQSRVSTGREALLAEVRKYERERGAQPSPGPDTAGKRNTATAAPRARPEPGEEGRDPSADWIGALLSGEAELVRRVLQVDTTSDPGASEARRRRLVPHVIPLLGNDALCEDALRYLRARGPRICGQLVDELLDSATPVPVRVQLASLLGSGRDARAMAGVWLAGSAPEFEVRLACGRAAARLASRDPRLAPPREAVLARVDAELDVSDERWASQGERPPPSPGDLPVLLSADRLARVSRSVEHVFNLLSVAHGKKLMASALAGIGSEDASLHGTALEYLESVLPRAQSQRLFERLRAGVATTSRRPRHEVEQLLLQSTADFLAEPDSDGS